MYMSYCRFEGTKAELRACLEAVEEHVNGEAEYAISEREIYNFKCMIGDIIEFIYSNDLMDEYGDVNDAALDDVCAAMAKGSDE